MSNVKPSQPSYLMGYWRPWKENSNQFDSWLDYTKDISLARYQANVIGKYFAESSAKQIEAIEVLQHKVTAGNKILNEIKSELQFLNRNSELLIDQQQATNLLLGNIVEQLKIPDNEKERQQYIERGFKFFANTKDDSSFYEDALENFLKAEKIFKQDFLVLYKIGLIYLFSEKHINPIKAKEYFENAAKYVKVENSDNIENVISVIFNHDKEKHRLFFYLLKKFEENNNCDLSIKEILERNSISNWYIIKDENVPESVLSLLEKKTIKKDEFTDFWKSNNLYLRIKPKGELGSLSLEVNKLLQNIENEIRCIWDNLNVNSINLFISECYSKAALSSYINSDFESAVELQALAVKHNKSDENYFYLAKYEARIKSFDACIKNLNKAIEKNPIMIKCALNEIEFLELPDFISFVDDKNNEIDNQIENLITKWESDATEEGKINVFELLQLKSKDYSEKVSTYNQIIKDDIKVLEQIDILIEKFKTALFCNYSKEQVNKYIIDLLAYKNSSLETKKTKWLEFENAYLSDIVKIKAKYGGGVVFYLDETGKHGLVVSENIIGEAIWDKNHDYESINGTKREIGCGRENTRLIVANKLAKFKNNVFTKIFSNTNNNKELTASELCTNLKLNGFEDWFLPSIDEILLLKNVSKDILNIKSNSHFWSSTESDMFNAYCLVNGNFWEWAHKNKNEKLPIFAVRTF